MLAEDPWELPDRDNNKGHCFCFGAGNEKVVYFTSILHADLG